MLVFSVALIWWMDAKQIMAVRKMTPVFVWNFGWEGLSPLCEDNFRLIRI
jgi:hypothetical protein